MSPITSEQLAALEADGWVVAERGLHLREGWLCILRRASDMRVELVEHVPLVDVAPEPRPAPHGCRTCRRLMRVNATCAVRQRGCSDRRELVRLAVHFRDYCHHHHTGGAL